MNCVGHGSSTTFETGLGEKLSRKANFWQVGILDGVLSKYLDKSHNFTNSIFMMSSL